MSNINKSLCLCFSMPFPVEFCIFLNLFKTHAPRRPRVFGCGMGCCGNGAPSAANSWPVCRREFRTWRAVCAPGAACTWQRWVNVAWTAENKCERIKIKNVLRFYLKLLFCVLSEFLYSTFYLCFWCFNYCSYLIMCVCVCKMFCVCFLTYWLHVFLNAYSKFRQCFRCVLLVNVFCLFLCFWTCFRERISDCIYLCFR